MAAPPPDENSVRIEQEFYARQAPTRDYERSKVGSVANEPLSKAQWELQLDEKLQETMRSTIKELQDKNDKITDDLNQIKKLNEEMETSTVEVFEENREQKRQNEELSRAYKKREKEVETAKQQNDELLAEMELMKAQIREKDELLFESLALLNPRGKSEMENYPQKLPPSVRSKAKSSKECEKHHDCNAKKGSQNTIDVLDFINGEKVPRFTHIYQLDDGTIVYHRYPHKLYVKWKGKKVKAQIPEGLEITLTSAIQTYGNAIYISEGEEIYKAVFTPPDSFLFYFVREHYRSERVGRFGCTWNRGRDTYVYRMCDNPETDGILVNFDENSLIGIFKRNVFYIEHDDRTVRPNLQKRGENVFAIVTSEKYWSQLVSDDSSSLVYYTEGSRNYLYTFDTKSMEFIPPLKCGRTIGSIVGVHSGWITTHYGSDEDVSFLLHAQLPVRNLSQFECICKSDLMQESTESNESSQNAFLQEANWALKVRNNLLTNELENVKRKYRRLLMMNGREVK